MAHKKNLSRYYFRKQIDDYNLENHTSMYFKEEYLESEVKITLLNGDNVMFVLNGLSSKKDMREDMESVLDKCYKELSISFLKMGITHSLNSIKNK